MTETPAIQVVQLSHSYNRQTALENVSFCVQPGEIFGLLGPNGGGKTTVFRILSTLLRPTAGTARILGADVTATPMRVREQIGVVFQASSVDAKLTPLENLRHQGHLHGMHGRELRQRAESLLARLGLSDRRDDRVETLSGGLRRRVQLAVGLLHRPPVLLLDEPSAGLDLGARRELRRTLFDLRENDDVTVLWTTHLMDEAESCDRVAILDRGRLVTQGTPAALKQTIGGEVLVLETDEPETLCNLIRDRFGGNPQVVGSVVRMEQPRAHSFVTQLVEALPGQINSVTVSRPTLEDVFIHETGHQFWDTGTEASADNAKSTTP